MILKPGCSAYRELDEYVCDRCQYRWDVKDDDPPVCELPGVVEEYVSQAQQDEINRRGMDKLKKVMNNER